MRHLTHVFILAVRRVTGKQIGSSEYRSGPKLAPFMETMPQTRAGSLKNCPSCGLSFVTCIQLDEKSPATGARTSNPETCPFRQVIVSVCKTIASSAARHATFNPAVPRESTSQPQVGRQHARRQMPAAARPNHPVDQAMVPEARLELACLTAADFESAASTIPPLGPGA